MVIGNIYEVLTGFKKQNIRHLFFLTSLWLFPILITLQEHDFVDALVLNYSDGWTQKLRPGFWIWQFLSVNGLKFKLNKAKSLINLP